MSDTIFVSWSKQPSGDLALLVRKWLSNLLPTCKPFFSRDIVKGREGDIEIKKGLGGASFGVLCVTRNNVGERWLLFEAGALYNRFETSEDTRVSPILFDVGVGEVGAPLSKLQCTTFSENEMRDLAFSINAVLAQPFNGDFVNDQFARLWPGLQESVSHTLAKAQSEGTLERTKEPTITELHEAVLRQGEMMQEVYRWVIQSRQEGTSFASPQVLQATEKQRLNDLLKPDLVSSSNEGYDKILLARAELRSRSTARARIRIDGVRERAKRAEAIINRLRAAESGVPTGEQLQIAEQAIDALKSEAASILVEINGLPRSEGAWLSYAEAHGAIIALEDEFNSLRGNSEG